MKQFNVDYARLRPLGSLQQAVREDSADHAQRQHHERAKQHFEPGNARSRQQFSLPLAGYRIVEDMDPHAPLPFNDLCALASDKTLLSIRELRNTPGIGSSDQDAPHEPYPSASDNGREVPSGDDRQEKTVSSFRDTTTEGVAVENTVGSMRNPGHHLSTKHRVQHGSDDDLRPGTSHTQAPAVVPKAAPPTLKNFPVARSIDGKLELVISDADRQKPSRKVRRRRHSPEPHHRKMKAVVQRTTTVQPSTPHPDIGFTPRDVDDDSASEGGTQEHVGEAATTGDGDQQPDTATTLHRTGRLPAMDNGQGSSRNTSSTCYDRQIANTDEGGLQSDGDRSLEGPSGDDHHAGGIAEANDNDNASQLLDERSE